MEKNVFISKLSMIKQLYTERSSTTKSYMKDTLEYILDDLASEDFFGTEAQNDPRGDQRDTFNEKEGCYNYYKIGDKFNFEKVIDNLIDYVKNEDDECINIIENEFNELFDEYI